MYDLIRNDFALQKHHSINSTTKYAELTDENRIEKEYAVFIISPEPVYKDFLRSKNELAAKLKISGKEIGSHKSA